MKEIMFQEGSYRRCPWGLVQLLVPVCKITDTNLHQVSSIVHITWFLTDNLKSICSWSFRILNPSFCHETHHYLLLLHQQQCQWSPQRRVWPPLLWENQCPKGSPSTAHEKSHISATRQSCCNIPQTLSLNCCKTRTLLNKITTSVYVLVFFVLSTFQLSKGGKIWPCCHKPTMSFHVPWRS